MADSPEILTSIHGREFGLDVNGDLVWNTKNGRGNFTSAQAAALAAVPTLTTGTTIAAAETNAAALQALLDTRKVVEVVAEAGEVFAPVRIRSGGKLRIRAGSTMKRANSINAPLIRSHYGGQMNKASRFNRVSNVVTVTNKYHLLIAGQLVWIANLTDTSMHGIQTVATVVDVDNWTYTSTGANGAGGASTVYGQVIPLRRAMAGTAFVSASNVVTVTDVGHDLRSGMTVWLGTTGASTAFCGCVDVIEAHTDSWQYVTSASGTGAATGTIAVSYDNLDSVITGEGTIDGNRANNGTVQDADMLLSTVMLGMVNHFTIDVKRVIGSDIRCINVFNGTDVNVSGVEFGDTLVAVQFEGGGKRCHVDSCSGSTGKLVAGTPLIDDFIAFTGTKYVGGGAIYDSATSPYGLMNFNVISARRSHAANCLNGVKQTSDVSVRWDSVVYEDITGGALNANLTPQPSAAIRMVDDQTGLQGMVCGSITIRRINWFGGSTGVNWGSLGTVDDMDIDGVTYTPNAQQALGTVGAPVNIFGVNGATSRIKRLSVRNLVNVSAGTAKPAIVLGSGNVKATNTITIDQFVLDGFDLTPTANPSGAAIIKYGNCTLVASNLQNGVFRGPASGTGYAINCVGPDNMGRWTLDNVRGVAGGTSLGVVMVVQNSDQTVCAGELVIGDGCDISAQNFLSDAASNWTGSMLVRVGAAKLTVITQFFNVSAATGLVGLFASPALSMTADKLFSTTTATVRVNGPSVQCAGSKVTAPQPGDVFWSTDTSLTGSALIGRKTRSNGGVWEPVHATVANLPAAATAGAGTKGFATDLNATTFASVAAAGGANQLPVTSNGTNWLIG